METRMIKWNEALAAAVKSVCKCQELAKKLGIKTVTFEDHVRTSAECHCVSEDDLYDLCMGFAAWEF